MGSSQENPQAFLAREASNTPPFLPLPCPLTCHSSSAGVKSHASLTPYLTFICHHHLNGSWQGQPGLRQKVFLDGHLPARCSLLFFLGSGSMPCAIESAFAPGGVCPEHQRGLWSQRVLGASANVRCGLRVFRVLSSHSTASLSERVRSCWPFCRCGSENGSDL